jgi:hypothetical protein
VDLTGKENISNGRENKLMIGPVQLTYIVSKHKLKGKKLMFVILFDMMLVKFIVLTT